MIGQISGRTTRLTCLVPTGKRGLLSAAKASATQHQLYRHIIARTVAASAAMAEVAAPVATAQDDNPILVADRNVSFARLLPRVVLRYVTLPSPEKALVSSAWVLPSARSSRWPSVPSCQFWQDLAPNPAARSVRCAAHFARSEHSPSHLGPHALACAVALALSATGARQDPDAGPRSAAE
jgi:hypothetical protein